MAKLDLMKDKWFFAPRTKEEGIAFQKWAFSKGLSWSTSATTVQNNLGTESIGGNGHSKGRLGHASYAWYKDRGHVQISPRFKTEVFVDSVELPDLESQQQKQIRELEETIARATQQIQELKKDI